MEVKGRLDPVKSLVWNSRTCCLMAAMGSSVVVFKVPKRCGNGEWGKWGNAEQISQLPGFFGILGNHAC